MNSRVDPVDILCAFAEPFCRSGRVLVIGDARDVDSFGRLGSRLVCVLDPNLKGPHGGPRRPSSQAMKVVGDLSATVGESDKPFDTVLVVDARLLERPALSLPELRKKLKPDGTVWVFREGSASGGEGGHYYELYDRMTATFRHVKMIGQVPFAGASFVEFGVDESELRVRIDTQLLDEPDRPIGYLALGSDKPISLAAYTIVQTPAREAKESAEGARKPDRAGQFEMVVRQLEQSAGELRERLAQAEADLADRDQTIARLAIELGVERQKPQPEPGEFESIALRCQAAEHARDELAAELKRVSEIEASEVRSVERRLRATARHALRVEQLSERRAQFVRELLSKAGILEQGARVDWPSDERAGGTPRRESERLLSRERPTAGD